MKTFKAMYAYAAKKKGGEDALEGMMPKLKGVAKIRIDRRRYAWIWTRRLVNWLRMKLWI
jgi:hypothetical protein